MDTVLQQAQEDTFIAQPLQYFPATISHKFFPSELLALLVFVMAKGSESAFYELVDGRPLMVGESSIVGTGMMVISGATRFASDNGLSIIKRITSYIQDTER
jgi:hypothetical protein